MRILAVADEEAAKFYDFYEPGALKEFDLIIACGDLSRPYLEFLVTMANCPLLYVHGNHDDSFRDKPPEGCICIDGRLYEYNGIRFLGLGGSWRYKDTGIHMYSEKEMKQRVRRLWFLLRKKRGFDILVTHAPAYQINDFNNVTHRGFQTFVDLLDQYEPKYFIHGHIHKNYGVRIPRETKRGNTTILNACGYSVFEI